MGCGDPQLEEVIEVWRVKNKDFWDLVWKERRQVFEVCIWLQLVRAMFAQTVRQHATAEPRR